MKHAVFLCYCLYGICPRDHISLFVWILVGHSSCYFIFSASVKVWCLYSIVLKVILSWGISTWFLSYIFLNMIINFVSNQPDIGLFCYKAINTSSHSYYARLKRCWLHIDRSKNMPELAAAILNPLVAIL